MLSMHCTQTGNGAYLVATQEKVPHFVKHYMLRFPPVLGEESNMEIQDFSKICHALPGVTEDVKWTNNLCFCVANKMFLILGLEQSPTPASFKVPDEEFYPMSHRAGFKPAPYLARYKWVWTGDINTLNQEEWEHYIQQSYEIVKRKLPARVRKSLR